ncbi:MAG: glycosyltransferase [Phycisphaerae bacterium]|nr:glycosyltransferase [Phycisphaerae bacterium]
MSSEAGTASAGSLHDSHGSQGVPHFGYAPADLAAPPAVSIVTAVRQAGDELQRTAASLFRQSFQAWEWLLILERAPDPGAQIILDQYRQRDPRVRVIDMPQGSGTGARAAISATARSAYVWQLDEGAEIEPTALEELYWFFETHPECGGCHAQAPSAGMPAPSAVPPGAGCHAQAPSAGMPAPSAGPPGAMPGAPPKRWYSLKKGLPEGARRAPEPFESLAPAPIGLNRLAPSAPRLLMIIPRLSLGGAERAALELLKQLAQRGWEVTVAALHGADPRWTGEFTRFTPDVLVLPKFRRLPAYPAFLHYLIASRQPQFVLTSGSELGYLLLPYLRSTCPEPVYLDLCHSEAPHWKNGGYARYAAGYQDYVDLTLVTSEHLKRYIVQRGGDAARIEVLYLNIDPELWRPCPRTRERVRRELGLAPDEVCVLFAGRLDAEKQPRVLAATLHKLATRKQPFRALLAGDGAERDWVEQFIRQHGLTERVRLLGEVPAERLRELLAAADIFFLPSLWEGIALTIYEAMACGLAVVGADVGGQRELVTPECGVLLPKRGEAEEAAAYAAVLEELIQDERRRHTLGRNARQRIEAHFTLRAMAERFFELLERGRTLRNRTNRPVLPPAAARESAAQAIEFVRVNEALDASWRQAQSIWRDYQQLSAEQCDGGAAAAFLERAGLAAGSAKLSDDERLRRAEQAGLAVCAELNRVSAELASIYNSTGWRLLQTLYRLRFFVFPRGSWRERVGRRCMHALRQLRQRLPFDRPLARTLPHASREPRTERERKAPALPKPESHSGRRPLRVLLQVEHFEQGGLEQVMLDLAATLSAAQMAVGLLVLGRQGTAAFEARRAGLPILHLPQLGRAQAYHDLLRDWDLVNAHHSLFGVELVAEAGRPFVQTVHSAYVGLDANMRAAYRRADPATTAYVCVSKAAAYYAQASLGLSPQRMLVIPNGIDLEKLDAARAATDRAAQRRALGLADQDFVFLNVASIYPPKAQGLLVAALQRARQHNPHLKLALLGPTMDEAYAKSVREQAERLGVADAILWLGHRPDPQQLYMLCDAFVLPSFVEGWSLSLAEALYARLPIVATEVGASADLVDPQRGRLVPPPYASILDIDGAESFARLLAKEQPQFVENLSAAMLAVSECAAPPPIPPDLARRLDRRYAYQGYVRLFESLAAGEHATVAQPWASNLHEADPSQCAALDAQPAAGPGARKESQNQCSEMIAK